jgi:hypothetical protein
MITICRAVLTFGWQLSHVSLLVIDYSQCLRELAVVLGTS